MLWVGEMARMAQRSAVLVGIVSCGAALGAALSGLGLWNSVLALGEPEYAVERADEVAAVATQLTKGFVLDDKSADLVRSVYRDLLSLNLGRLYELLPSSKGDSRWMGMEGQPTDQGYALTLMAADPDRSSPALGAMAGWIGMVPTEQRFGQGTPYEIDQRFDVATGGVGPEDLQRFLTGLMISLEQAADRPQPTWAVAAVQESEPQLEGTHARLLASMYTAMPTAAEALTDVVRVQSIGSMVPCGDGDCLAYNIDLSIDPNGIRRAQYRHLASTIRKWGNLAEGQVRIRLPNGSDLAHLAIQTKPAGLRLRFLSQNGRIIPVNMGKVSLDEALSLEDLDQLLDIEIRADVTYEGFTLKLRDLHFPGRLVMTDREASLSGQINETPDIEFTGTDAVRSSLASFADNALGLGDHGRDFARYVAEGRRGEGSRVSVRLKQGAKSGILEESVDLVLLDNALIRFAFRVVGGRLIPEERAIDDFSSLMKKIITAVVDDYQKVRAQLAAAPSSTP
jgi:hypothetical protein